jgi:signal transduction histidine kinase
LNEVLYNIYIQKKKPQKAILYLQKILEIKAARLDEEKKIKLNELNVSFKIKEKDKENKILLEKNLAAKNRLILWIVISFILTALIMIILYIYFRLKSSKIQLENLQLKSSEVNIKLNELINEKKHIINLIIHDIRTPLNIIQLNNKILQHNSTLDSNSFKYIEEATDQIYDAILKIQETENKTLDQTYFDFSVVDLKHMINLTINDFEAYAKSKEIAIHFKMPTASYLANADPFLLRHVLSNLISNAIKFSDNHTHIDIDIRSNNNEIQIDIKDQGDGLDPAIFESIYTDMEMGVNSEKAKNSWGKGLKLALMFVRKMEGDISMMSTKGQGTIFTIHLPKYLK